jgi:uncharacterized tellurite resistance protein B-like protein
MEKVTFNKLLLNTAFCCMVIDSKIDKREVATIMSMCKKTPYYKHFNFEVEINALVTKINQGPKEYISSYLEMINNAALSENQELQLIEFALNTIKADEQIKFSEIKFFKIIRPCLKISNERILDVFPDIGQFLVKGKLTESFIKKITTLYLDNIELPKFEFISLFEDDSVGHVTTDEE